MLSNLPRYLAYAKKAIVQVVGLATALLSLGLLPEPYSAWVTTAIAVLTTILHYMVTNASAPGDEPAIDTADQEEPEQPAEWQPAALVTAGQVAAQHEAQNTNPPST